METKHTPGPWETSRGAQNYPFSIESESKTIAFIKMQTEVRHTTANAKLIAAAPDLLDACQEGYDLITDICNAAGNDQPYSKVELERICVDIWDQMHKAIQKATD